ncbi:MAG: hypothetical protein KAJ10_13860 [Thermodesulfovibrionia bacterium]|nr:hypothetical protein [Thermodesulfovibrionia bacterium]
MKSRFLVCPFNEELINSLRGESLVININTFDEISAVVDIVKQSQAHLHCLKINTNVPVSSIPFHKDWMNIPIALYASRLGRFSDFGRRIPVIRQLNLRIYLPSNDKEAYTGIRILSSLGIEAAITMTEGDVNWELLSDLMSYAYFGLIPHAPIAPFGYIATNYNPQNRTDFGAVYFDDQHQYLHLDVKGRVALSQRDLDEGNFIAQKIHDIGDLAQNDKYGIRLNSWRDFFLKTDGCAYCQGWRVCLGKFSDASGNGNNCRIFFAELLDSVQQHQSLQKGKEKVTWQP